MKIMTLKELNKLTNISVGTIRVWITKPINNIPYSSNNINYDALRKGLKKYFDKFDEKFGFSVEEIEIVKSEKSSKEYVEVEDLKLYDNIILHNYALQTKMTFMGIKEFSEDEKLYIFKLDKGWKCYDTDEMKKDNMKIEKVSE